MLRSIAISCILYFFNSLLLIVAAIMAVIPPIIIFNSWFLVDNSGVPQNAMTLITIALSIAFFLGVFFVWKANKWRISLETRYVVLIFFMIFGALAFLLVIFGLLMVTNLVPSQPTDKIIGIIAIISGIAIIIYYNIRMRQLNDIGKTGFLHEINNHHSARSNWELGTGISISLDDKTIVLAEGKFIRTYSFDNIRSFHSTHDDNELASTVYGQNVSPFARLFAQDSMGIIINVKDVDDPEWLVRIKSASKARQWIEILTQSLSD